ncbi:MAG: valine--tRNA ligase, partial [Gammaproteobacteria bacterium]|nr:valine--tRNA ligase [Gammaproteobacteria bacterium]
WRMESRSGLFYPMAGIDKLTLIAANAEVPPAASALHGELKLLTPLAGVIDPAAERARLDKLRAQAEKSLQAAENKLANPQFLDKAPPDVVQSTRKRQAELRSDLERLKEQLARLEGL